VYRIAGDTVSYLLVRPKSGKDEWVLPKGHIEKGEDEKAAALREVREETGVVARAISPLESVEFQIKSEIVRVIFFLLEFASQEEPAERRETGWFELTEALKRLTHPQSKQVMQAAEKERVIVATRQGQASQRRH
jgi:ADP-ribose pyrophosphatase YjhB (NUDIX family)